MLVSMEAKLLTLAVVVKQKMSRLPVWPLSISMWVLFKVLIPVSLSSVVKISEALLKSAVTERDGSKSVLGHVFKRLESP